jgi:hypothetical protein
MTGPRSTGREYTGKHRRDVGLGLADPLLWGSRAESSGRPVPLDLRPVPAAAPMPENGPETGFRPETGFWPDSGFRPQPGFRPEAGPWADAG